MAEQNVMNRIMKLMERANHPSTPPHEAALAAERAEALMAQHQIDRMDLKPEDRSKIVQTSWDLHVGSVEGNFRYHIVQLMEAVTKHCSIRVDHTPKIVRKDDGSVDYSRRRYTLVGFPEDMAYAEQIWFRVFKEFVSSINPQWDSSKSLGQNAYEFLQAGIKWSEIWSIAYREQPEEGYGMRSGRNVKMADPRTTKYNSSLKKAVKEYMEDNDLGEYTAHTQRHDVYRNNFAESYYSTISSRLRDIRRKAEDTVADSDRYALALRTTDQQVEDEFYRLFPQYDPEVRRKMREAEAFEAACAFAALDEDTQQQLIAEEAERVAAQEARWAKASKRAKRGYTSVRSYSSHDPNAWARGKAAGQRVNLNVDGEVKKQDKKGLGA